MGPNTLHSTPNNLHECHQGLDTCGKPIGTYNWIPIMTLGTRHMDTQDLLRNPEAPIESL